jgi:N-acyl-D-amino-acid deacylase
MLSVKIAGGLVYDGSGAPPARADVGIEGDRITTVGDLGPAEAQRVIDAAGLSVAPGFIDVHSHSDSYLLIEPDAPSKLLQGVTTEVVGNCGASAAPLAGQARLPSDWAAQAYPGTWRTVAEYRALLEAVGPAPNVVLLIGHNTLRAGVTGYAQRAANADEVGRMAAALEQALDEGGTGFSTGLLYSPGRYARREELTALARVVGARGGIYASHLRSEGKHLLPAIDEALELGRAGGARVQISHLKASGKANWHLLDGALAAIRAARANGEPVAADRYPYTGAGTELDVILPDWAADGGREAELARLAEPSTRARLRRELSASRSPDYWTTVVVGSTAHPGNRRFRGMRIDEVARELATDPAEAVLTLVERDRAATGAFFMGMSEDNMRRVLAEPYVMISSDASLRAPAGPLGRDHPHPRAYGAFPRALRMAIDGRTVPLSEAIRKMTSLPARHFGLKDRGAVRRGAFADLTVFDQRAVRDRATYADPHQPAEGIRHVLVNGAATVSAGRLTGSRAGRFLGPPRSS